MLSADDRAALRALIVDVDGFPQAGIVFRDITALLADPRALRTSVAAMAEPYRQEHVELVAGVESRGFILGGAVACALDCGFVPVRKRGRLPRATVSLTYQLEYGEAELEVHADAATRGQRVLVVDDVLASGGTAAATASLLKQLEAEVVGFSFLLELLALSGAAALAGVRHHALLQI